MQQDSRVVDSRVVGFRPGDRAYGRQATAMRFAPSSICLLALIGSFALSQTTQGLITGRVVDSVSGQPVAAAQISWFKVTTPLGEKAVSDSAGYFNLPLLSPGLYHLRIDAPGYQGQETYELDLPVAGRLDINFRLRPLTDVWEAGQYRSVYLPKSNSVLPFFGPDVDPSHTADFDTTGSRSAALETSVSQVIDGTELQDLPLNGRDVYALLVTQPGVTADAATGRGLGISVNGQRPTSSNFLLDGLENDNFLTTGPLVTVAPDVVQEYRLSTSNFSAEFGRTGGVLANAVTRSGSNDWHGFGYYYLKNDLLDANGFQENLEGFRTPLKYSEPGFFVGGPILRNVLFVSASFDYQRFRSESDPQDYLLPTPQLAHMAGAGTAARQLLEMFPAPVPANATGQFANLQIAPPVAINQLLALPRIDYLPREGRDHIMARLALSRVDQPDFEWTPYPQFITPLHEYATGLGVSWTRQFTPSTTNEARFGWSNDNLFFNRSHPEIPYIQVGGDNCQTCTMPGSPLFYSYQNDSHYVEFNENLVHEHGRHVFKAGMGVLARHLDGYLTAGRDGIFVFSDPTAFLNDQVFQFDIALTRSQLPSGASIPQYDRSYIYNQFFGFVQDSFKVTPRLVLNYGLRYDNYGAPTNVGPVKDALVRLGSGDNFVTRLENMTLPPPPTGGNQQLYNNDNLNFSPRLGFAYSLRNDGRAVVRGGYGIYYEAPFDNLWQTLRNNNVVLAAADQGSFGGPVNFLQPVAAIAASLPLGSLAPVNGGDFPRPTLFQPGFRNGYVQSFFLGVQQQWTEKFSLEVNGLGSLGRELVTTDLINRLYSLPFSAQNPEGYFTTAVPTIAYRANQGLSDYYALTLVGRYRTNHSLLQASYTWSKVIDNQSDPLLGDFFDLSFNLSPVTAAFRQQFNSNADRALANFDQRQNFVIFGFQDLPRLFASTTAAPLFRNWEFSGLAAVRSGFPYSPMLTFQGPGSIQILEGGGVLSDNTPNLVNPSDVYASVPVTGGKLLLNSSAFSPPATGALGSLGRNALEGPGLYSVDVSLSRGFVVPKLGEAGRIVVRADAFNVLNHANLNNPYNIFPSPAFGVATYGRLGLQPGFPALTPFNETARQVQLMLRVEF